MPTPGLPWCWGATPAEWSRVYRCDEMVPRAPCRVVRAVSAQAPADQVFRWLCQLRVAPYSYDLLDNLGRRSPRTLTPGLEHLAEGQSFMTTFALIHHVDGEQLTVVTTGRLGRLAPRTAITYAVAPAGDGHSRLIGVLAADGQQPRLRRTGLAWGDLVMMRRQLRTLAALSAAQG